MDESLARGDKYHARGWLKLNSVHAGGNWERLDDVSLVRIHHHHHLRLAAAGKQAPVLGVNGQRDSLSFRSDRPAVLDLESLGINGDNVILVFVVVIDHSLA